MQIFAYMTQRFCQCPTGQNHAKPVAALFAADSFSCLFLTRGVKVCVLLMEHMHMLLMEHMPTLHGEPPPASRRRSAAGLHTSRRRTEGELEILHSLTEAHILWTGLPYGAPDAELAIAVVSPAPELAACHGARMIASSGNRSHRHISSWIMLRGGGVGMKFNTNIKLYCDQMSPSCDQVLS